MAAIIINMMGKIAFNVPYITESPIDSNEKSKPKPAIKTVVIRVIKALLSPETLRNPSNTINKTTGVTARIIFRTFIKIDLKFRFIFNFL